MTEDGWPQISASTLADQVYAAVRARILDGDLNPGDFAREQEISDGMGVSRTPVREALGRLASEGFLERIPHRGFRVPAQSIDRLLDLYPIVSALELLAGRLAFPRVDEEKVATLRSINEALRSATAEPNVERAMELNNRFHATIAEASGNAALVELLDDFRSQLRRLETWYFSDRGRGRKSVREHDALMEALETGEMPRALEIFERNMSLTITTLLDEIEHDSSEAQALRRNGTAPPQDRETDT